MQTLYKYAFVLLMALSWGCSDFLGLDIEGVEEVNSANSLTVAIENPGDPADFGSFQLIVEGPKNHSASYNTPTVRLNDLPAGSYVVSVLRDGFIGFKKNVIIAPSPEEGVEQRYRVEIPLVKRGTGFRFSNASGASVMFPEGIAVNSAAAFPVPTGSSLYRSVRVDLPSCAIAGARCDGEGTFSVTVVPLHADVLKGKVGASGEIGLFRLDFEASSSLVLTKEAQVVFPVRLANPALRGLKFSLVRLENDQVSGLPRPGAVRVPVQISADGSTGSARISQLNADWVFMVEARLESSEAATGFGTLARSLRPGKSLSTELALKASVHPAFADLLGLLSPEVAVSEFFAVEPPRNKTAEVLANYQVRKVRLVNSFTNDIIITMQDIPNYPVMFKAIVAIPHDSGGGG